MWESSPLPERVAWMLQPWGSAHGVASGAVQPVKNAIVESGPPRRGVPSQRIGIERLDATLRLAWEHSPRLEKETLLNSIAQCGKALACPLETCYIIFWFNTC
jgi:hypothetical protein